MQLVDFFTLLFMLMGVVSAVLVAFHPNVLYAAVALVFSLLSVAGLYGVLGADFLAAVQLIIYVGGIIVVILFAIMMSENIYRARFRDAAGKFVIPTAVAALLIAGFLKLFHDAKLETRAGLNAIPTTEQMGRALVGPYALVFQYVAIVLLAGLIGAVVVARPHHGNPESEAEKK